MNRAVLWLVVLGVAFETGSAYFLTESSDDLAVLESTPGVSIIYPSSMGPELEKKADVKIEDKPLDKTSNELVTTTETVKTESTTQSENATTTATRPAVKVTVVSEDLGLETAESNITATVVSPSTTTTTTEKPVPTTTFTPTRSTSVQDRQDEVKPGVNRVWHFNNQGLNTNAVWFSSSRNDENNNSNNEISSSSSASASRTSPVYANRFQTQQPSASQLFVRKPIMAPDAEESSSFARRMLTFEPSLGEYSASSLREDERNLYYPEINRIRAAPVAASSVGATAVASSSAAASASSSSSSSSHAEHATSSSTNAYKYASNAANWNAASGIKGGGRYYESRTTVLQSPVKTVRRVVKTGKALVERERLTETVREPTRVRVVVQPQVGVKTTEVSQTSVNRLDRLQDNTKTSYFGTKSLSNEYNSAAASASAAAAASAVASTATTGGTKTIETTKTSRLVVAGTKSPPPPRVAAVKTVTKSIVRAPIYEQEPQRYEEPEQPEPEPYSFNFKVDDASGNGQFRREEQDANGVVRGSYGYTDAWGLYRIVDYVADANGFRASIRSNEPGLVEKNPVTNAVDEPAHIKVAAEDTPAKVLDLMRLPKQQPQF